MRLRKSKKLMAVVSMVMCISVLFSSLAVAQEEQYIDNSENMSYTEFETREGSVRSESLSDDVINFYGSVLINGNTETDGVGASSTISTPFFIALVHETPELFGKIKTIFFIGTKVKIKSFSGNYCLVESKNGTTGYVFKGWLDGGKDGDLSLSRTYDHVFEDATNSGRTKAVYDGGGTVTWSTDNEDIISVNPDTGVVTGKKAGTANLIAKVGSNEVSIPVYCIYKWKKAWTGAANKSTKIYTGTSSSTTSLATISSGTKFYVNGDDGGSDGWAYGYATVDGSQKWGFVKINDISTKGTVSQYNYMPISNEDEDKNTYWKWPVTTQSGKTNANYIQSPYGKRDTNPSMHKGMDITTGNKGEIEGYEVVSAFTGKVVYISTSSTSSTGYCVGIRSNIKDPVSGENFIAFYMHLKEIPTVSWNKEVLAGETLGYVGTTGNSSGHHLHFEVNNKNASIGDGSTARQFYAYLINPLYYYMDKTVRINNGCDAETKYYGTYWYGND